MIPVPAQIILTIFSIFTFVGWFAKLTEKREREFWGKRYKGKDIHLWLDAKAKREQHVASQSIRFVDSEEKNLLRKEADLYSRLLKKYPDFERNLDYEKTIWPFENERVE